MRDTPTQPPGHGAALLLPALRGRTASGVSLFAPGEWRAELGLEAFLDDAPADLPPVPLDAFGLTTRRTLHIVVRTHTGLPIDRIAAALDPQAPTIPALRNLLTTLTERGLLVNTASHGRHGHWRATPLSRTSAQADILRSLPPRDVMAAVRALTDRAHPPALARWWPVADERQQRPPATAATVMGFLFGLQHPIASAPDLPARIEAALDALVQARALIALAAPRGKHLTRCYWPATQEDPA